MKEDQNPKNDRWDQTEYGGTYIASQEHFPKLRTELN
jgi:hypothetical protein